MSLAFIFLFSPAPFYLPRAKYPSLFYKLQLVLIILLSIIIHKLTIVEKSILHTVSYNDPNTKTADVKATASNYAVGEGMVGPYL